MAKQFFKDLPDTSTPLTASRLNGLLDGEEAMGNLVVDSIRSKNMLNQNIYDLGYYDNSGTFTNSSTNVAFSYIPVESNNNYVFSAVSNCQNIAIVEFDSSKTFIKRNILFSNKAISITTTSTTKYIRCQLNYNNSAITKDIIDTLKPQFETGDTATTYSPFQNLTGKENYTTEEQVIGTWLGKPLYRKVIDFGNLPNNTTGTKTHGISNYDDVVNLYGVARYDTFRFPIPQATNQSSQGTIGMWLGANSISIRTTTNMSSYTAYVVVEYTKTTV